MFSYKGYDRRRSLTAQPARVTGDRSERQPATYSNPHRTTVSIQLLSLSHMPTISDSLEPESSHHKRTRINIHVDPITINPRLHTHYTCVIRHAQPHPARVSRQRHAAQVCRVPEGAYRYCVYNILCTTTYLCNPSSIPVSGKSQHVNNHSAAQKTVITTLCCRGST